MSRQVCLSCGNPALELFESPICRACEQRIWDEQQAAAEKTLVAGSDDLAEQLLAEACGDGIDRELEAAARAADREVWG